MRNPLHLYVLAAILLALSFADPGWASVDPLAVNMTASHISDKGKADTPHVLGCLAEPDAINGLGCMVVKDRFDAALDKSEFCTKLTGIGDMSAAPPGVNCRQYAYNSASYFSERKEIAHSGDAFIGYGLFDSPPGFTCMTHQRLEGWRLDVK